MASGIFDDALIKHLWSSDECRAIFNDENRVRKWYEFEAALAIEQAAMGIIPQEAADEIVARVKTAKIDIEAIGAEIRRIKHPLVPALKALQAQCKGDLGEYIHFGPTTQDVLDTGTVLRNPNALTGVYFITHDAAGHHFHHYRANSPSALYRPTDLPADAIARARMLYLSGISQGISASAADAVFHAIETARAAGVHVAYDTNYRPRLWPAARAAAAGSRGAVGTASIRSAACRNAATANASGSPPPRAIRAASSSGIFRTRFMLRR